MTSVLASLFALAILTLLPAHAAPPQYTLLDLGAVEVRGIDLTGSGVVGDSTNTAAILYPSLLLLDTRTSSAYAVRGEYVVGASVNTLRGAWRWTAATGLLPLPSLATGRFSTVADVNSLGTAVGFGDNSTGTQNVALRWTQGVPVALPTRNEGSHFALSINDAGDIVGYGDGRAVLWPMEGGIVELHTPGDVSSVAHTLNTLGQAVGVRHLPAMRGYLWSVETGMVTQPPLPGDTQSIAYGLNDHGVVVGESRIPHQNVAEFLHRTAVLWEDGQPFDLLPQITNSSGWSLNTAVGINNAGVIAGMGIFGGQRRGFVLTPLPEGAAPPPGGPVASNRRDLNGDGQADLVWQHTGTGDVAVWYLDGTGLLAGEIIAQVDDPHWQLVSLGDLDADGHPDLVWRHAPTGTVVLWFMNGVTLRRSATLQSPREWTLTAVGDLNGDGHADFLWRHSTSGQVATWLMQGSSVLAGVFLEHVPDLQWRLLAVEDMDGDGQADLVWQHAGTGQVGAWTIQGFVRTSSRALPTTGDPQWHLSTVGDVDGDGHPDLIWRHAVTGWVAAWRLNGGSVVGTGWVGQADTGWVLR